MGNTTAQNMPPVIQMEDVAVVAMQDQRVVLAENISWKVLAGDYWVVEGSHGSGKSDFLMMTGGVMAPSAGSYTFLGERMPIFDEARLKHRLRMGLAFDGGRLISHLTVWDNVALPWRYHQNLSVEESRTEVDELIEALDLAPWADSTPGALGREWQRRTGLARALILKPEVLLVDNPLIGLDPRHSEWWLQFLDQLHQGHPLLRGRPVTLVVTAGDARPFHGHARQFARLEERRLEMLKGMANS